MLVLYNILTPQLWLFHGKQGILEYKAVLKINTDQNMDQDEGFWQKNRTYLIVGVVVVVAVIIALVNRNNKTSENQNQNGQQEVSQQQGGDINGATSTPSSSSPSMGGSTANGAQGNVSAVGTLRESDNAAKGNLMVESNRGKIYVQTVRDFSSLVGKQVTLQADGSLESFKFLGFAEAQATSQTPPTGSTGQPSTSAVKFSGVLGHSSNAAKGNYTIVSGKTTVYLQTAHNYDAWVGGTVELSANGSLQSFTGATLSKK